MAKRQVIVFDGYVPPKSAGPPCEECVHKKGVHCSKRDIHVNPLGTCNHWSDGMGVINEVCEEIAGVMESAAKEITNEEDAKKQTGKARKALRKKAGDFKSAGKKLGIK